MGKPRISDHFWDYVDRSGECWGWLGSTDSLGYGNRIVSSATASSSRSSRALWPRGRFD